MRELLDQIVEWFLDLHTLAKVAWIMSVVVALLFIVPWFFGESLIKGDADDRTKKAAKTLRQLETLSDNQGYNTGPPSKRRTTTQRREERRELGNDYRNNDDNDNDNDNDNEDDDDDDDRGSRGSDL
jgi:hypothetical protein